jgi:hypothetical protein
MSFSIRGLRRSLSVLALKSSPKIAQRATREALAAFYHFAKSKISTLELPIA